MAKFELKLPKMGESVAEATITNWLKNVGETIAADEAVLEIATDKVDSEVPSEVSGTLVEILFQVNDVVKVGQTIAIIETEGGSATVSSPVAAAAAAATPVAEPEVTAEIIKEVSKPIEAAKEVDFSNSDKFFSPLVKNIAKEEGVSIAELEGISGSGKEGRVTKEDILKYVESRKSGNATPAPSAPSPKPVAQVAQPVSVNGGDEIVEMDRMR
ncbi:biotin/lipoyl-containing protein, partial [Flavobacterium sp.]|uniref:biotin/lipoyl-containing protein n=1 Tax=Flavobacterium sp. TaxID=239 RepID=UPI0038CF9A2C